MGWGGGGRGDALGAPASRLPARGALPFFFFDDAEVPATAGLGEAPVPDAAPSSGLWSTESSPRSDAWMISLPRGWSVMPLRAGVEKV